MWNPFRRSVKSYSTLDLYKEVFGGRGSYAGRSVTAASALQVATVLACVRVIADGIAQVPLKLHRAAPGSRGREEAREHPLFDVLHRQPNPWQSSYEYRETLAMHTVLCGNHYAFKNVVRGRVVELIPFEPGQVAVKRGPDGTLAYEVRVGSEKREFPAAAIWHVRGPSWNGWLGMEAVSLARDAIGLAMAVEETQAKQHVNGARPGGVLSIEGTLNDEQYAKWRKWLDDKLEGIENSGRTVILDRNAKWQAIGSSSADAQIIETRRYQVEEICRAFRVMPIMLGHADKTTTYASAEQMFLAHVVHTLSPWYERIEQSIDVQLLSAEDRAKGLYAKFVAAGLLRGALKDTAEYLTKLTDRGVMTRNEAREKLDLNPLDGLDEPLTPVNMTIGADPAPAEGASQ